MIDYIECPLSGLPAEEDLFSLFSEENLLPNQEKRKQFLCYIRLMCLNFLEEKLTGAPSSLLETQIKQAIGNTSYPYELDMKFGSVLSTLRSIEYEQESFFNDVCALQQMEQCYNNLKELLQEIKNTTKKEIGAIFEKDSSIKCITLSVTEALFSNDQQTFFKAFIHTFEGYCKTLSTQCYFKKTAWANRQDHLNENNLTEKFRSYLEMSLAQYPLSIRSQKKCGSGYCDILIETPNKEVIPIEAKTSEHQELWKAIEEQLVAKYLQDTHNYGIYLVYWFGQGNLMSPSELCVKPNTHSELEASLVKYCIPSSHKDRIKVFCINCE